MPFTGSAMDQDALSVLKGPLPTWGGVAPDKRLRKPWKESEEAAIKSLKKITKGYAARHGEARLNADPEAKMNAGQTKQQKRSAAMEALKKVAEEGKHEKDMSKEEISVNDILKDGLRDFIDDALDEAERYKRVDRSVVKVDFKWEVVGNFNEFPALHRSRQENGPGKPYQGGENANSFEATVFALSDLGLILESPRDGRWSRFGGNSPVILDILPGSAAARAQPRIKRGLRLQTVNGKSLASLGPEGFKRVQGIRPLRLGVMSQTMDYTPGAGKHCEALRPDIFARTMAVDFMRDFGPSEDEIERDRARKEPRFEHSISWSDSKGLGDLERRVTRLHRGLRQTGWPPGTQPPTQSRMQTGSKLTPASSQVGFATSGRQSPGSSPLGRLASPTSLMNLSASSPNLSSALRRV